MISYLKDTLNRISSHIDPSQSNKPLKKNVLVIQCHPIRDSFSSALLEAVKCGLEESGQIVRVKRLYSNNPCKTDSYGNYNFQPLLTDKERLEYHNNANLRESEAGIESMPVTSQDIAEAVKDLRWANAIVFVYPTWWFNFPAALKGYFDRVMLPGVAFKLPVHSDTNTTKTGLVPGLTNISKIGVVTVKLCFFRNLLFFAWNKLSSDLWSKQINRILRWRWCSRVS